MTLLSQAMVACISASSIMKRSELETDEKIILKDFNTFGSNEDTTEYPDTTSGATETTPYPEFKCTSSGFVCDGCGTSYYCIQISDNEFLPQKVQDCPTGSSCLASTGECTDGINVACGQNNFVCHQLGMFPEPTSCKAYHICYNGSSSMYVECPKGYGYNPLTTMCSLRGDCERPMPACKENGQIGGVSGHPNMYYICLKFDKEIPIHHLYYCPVGQEFVDGACKDSSPVDGVDEDGVCYEEGKFHYEGNCKLYHECPKAGNTAEVKTCPSDMRFNYRLGKCVDFEC